LDKIKYYLNPINVIKAVIEFFLRKDILQIAIIYVASDFVRINGFFEQYIGNFNYDIYIIEDFIINLSGISITNNAMFILVIAIFLESYSDYFPFSFPHYIAELISPALIVVSVWALSGNFIFAFVLGILKHIVGKKEHPILAHLEANGEPIFQVPF